jgi:hypothetical protein
MHAVPNEAWAIDFTSSQASDEHPLCGHFNEAQAAFRLAVQLTSIDKWRRTLPAIPFLPRGKLIFL